MNIRCNQSIRLYAFNLYVFCMRALAVAFLLFTVEAASAQPQLTPDQIRLRGEAAQCVAREIPDLDDRASDAKTIAAGVVEACNREVSQFIDTFTQIGPADRTDLKSFFKEDLRGAALAWVLAHRARLRKPN